MIAVLNPPALRAPRMPRKTLQALTLTVLLALGLGVAFPSLALDLVAFTGITGPLVSILTQLAALSPGFKAIAGVIGFFMALMTLIALRNFSGVLYYLGLAVFAAVGLVVAGAIMGAVI